MTDTAKPTRFEEMKQRTEGKINDTILKAAIDYVSAGKACDTVETDIAQAWALKKGGEAYVNKNLRMFSLDILHAPEIKKEAVAAAVKPFGFSEADQNEIVQAAIHLKTGARPLFR